MSEARWLTAIWSASGLLRDRIAAICALATLGATIGIFLASNGTAFLMPGPLTSAHGSIEKCSTCHTKSGDGKVGWVHGLVAGDPLADSKACLTCHKMPETAFNAHGASAVVLQASTERLTKIAAEIPVPQSARIQSAAFPTHEIEQRGVYCATCHQEHQGAGFKLAKISNEQCRSCHVAKFDAFDGNHPKFDAYPFKRRTQIVYDHAGHFGKHYPEVAKKEPAKRIPATCSTCHNSQRDKRVMAVAPFEQTCAGCHLDQITGKERVEGPKGIAFLTLPGLDVQTLKSKNAALGEWPDASDAALTPFMKVMISRSDKGRALLKTVAALNLQDLSSANDEQIKAVTELAWEIKNLFNALISGKASDVLGNFNIGGGAKLSTTLVADLTASIPRDVLISAQQQWLPNLAREIAGGPMTPEQIQAAAAPPPQDTKAAEPEKPADPEPADEPSSKSSEADESERKDTKKTQLDAPPCLLRVLGQCLMTKETPATPPGPASDAGKSGAGFSANFLGAPSPSAGELPPPMHAGLTELAQAANSADELLNLSDEERRAMEAVKGGVGKSSGPSGGAPAGNAQSATPVISIDSGVDPESWAEYGGWYRQDYAIYYRPTGHKDKFVYAWLFLTGPQAPKGGGSPSAAVFDALTGKDAQGSCTKCHSVDDLQGKGRLVNFLQPAAESKQGSFTRFIHEPHFSVQGDRGCLTCHELDKSRPYLKSYEQGDPHVFASSFASVKKDVCQTCHKTSMARQDCLTCHKYHVNGATTPIMQTKLPVQ